MPFEYLPDYKRDDYGECRACMESFRYRGVQCDYHLGYKYESYAETVSRQVEEQRVRNVAGRTSKPS